MKHKNTIRIAIYTLTFLIIIGCAMLQRLTEKSVKITATMINAYCLMTSSTQRMQFRATINDQLNGHSIQIYCNLGESNTWQIVANQ